MDQLACLGANCADFIPYICLKLGSLTCSNFTINKIPSEALSKNRPHPDFYRGLVRKDRITVEVCGLKAAQILSIRRFVTL